MFQLFQTKDGPFFFIVALVFTCRAFFAVSSENICPIYCFGHSSSQSVSQWNYFFPLKYIVYKCFSCFRPSLANFFHCHTCLHLSRFFCSVIRKYLSHILFWSQLVSVCFTMKFFFSFKIYCLQMFQLFQTKDGPFFFIVTLVYTCRAFFCCIIRKYLSNILFWSQFVSVCFAMKLFFSFQIHCLQMLQLFQIRDGPFFFSSSHLFTLVYTCRAFFAVSSENICPIYCFGHSSSQSVSQWNSFSPLKYIVYKCFSCFRPGMGHFFSSSHLSRFFLLCHQKIFVPYIVLVTARLSLSFKKHCLQVFQLFQTKDGPVFFIVTLVYTCRAFFAVSSENICPIYCFGHSSSLCVSQWNSFFPLKYIVYKCFSCFRPRMSQFFFSVTVDYTCRAFFAVSSENIYPIYCFGHSLSQSVLHWNSFSPLKSIVYKCYSCFRPRMGRFISSSHLSTLVALFLLCHQKIFVPYIVLVTARFSLFRNETLFLLSNTLSTNVTVVSDQWWAFFFHSHTCRAFFAVSSKTIYPIYCFGHSSSQSVSQWNSFSPLKYIVYKCYSCFRPRMGHFFSS